MRKNLHLLILSFRETCCGLTWMASWWAEEELSLALQDPELEPLQDPARWSSQFWITLKTLLGLMMCSAGQRAPEELWAEKWVSWLHRGNGDPSTLTYFCRSRAGKKRGRMF